MAPSSVSEEQRAARDEMAIACAEVACALRSLAEVIKAHPELAKRAERIAKNFERLELEATGDRPISDLNLRSCARAFEDSSRQLEAAGNLVRLLPAPAAVEGMRERLEYLDELVNVTFVLVDVDPTRGALS